MLSDKENIHPISFSSNFFQWLHVSISFSTSDDSNDQ
uniref:Uncharacterized protein n=1 Tax=Rhizophora mucronata TaxID=61149 RepID=A0A2P2PQM1_RHIMU